ncbi:cobalamin biosynthesis protein CobQ [Alkalispirochaeta sphaeroplastigenens]|uniref:Cobalamin biosynthesis protein CobQ n=1 Tax=Alkalispirochaeta sphaeroplastigenens TaxID=1187066 RepID=A0A2S4JGX8_9SPIO|nr:P-loop NTPase [Alkalispirochaeta sphaeroplastigenens]POQ98670.1 cobalamin biosynthesis protein CobQ [Alkalispirochaeta sphaeroplastigenens]
MVITQRRNTKIIPIAGGKGGIGKTELCANLGVRLGQLGYRTIVVDLDLGGSNLHSALGVKNKNPGLGNFLSDRALSFEALLSPTPYQNLQFIPGDVLVAGTPNITYAQKRSILRNLEEMDADYILLDLGAGASNNVVDFFLVANSGLIVTSPHVGAIVNAYSFLKNAVFRFLFRAFSGESEVEKFLRNQIKERRPGNPVKVSSVLEAMAQIDTDQALKAKRYIDLLQPLLVLNMVRSTDDLNIGESLRDLVGKNLSITFDALGMIVHDESLAAAHRAHKPVVAANPDSFVGIEIDRIAQKIVQSPEFPTLALEKSLYADSYELLRIEAQNDLSTLQSEQNEEALRSESDAAEFIEVLTAQKKQIQELQGTIRMLTMRQG